MTMLSAMAAMRTAPTYFMRGRLTSTGSAPKLLQGGDGLADAGFDLAVDGVEEVVGGDAHAEAGDATVDVGGVVGDGDGHGAGVKGVVAGGGLEHEGGVGDGAGHGADVVAVEAGDHETALADPAVGLLEADDAAEGAGEADRAS